MLCAPLRPSASHLLFVCTYLLCLHVYQAPLSPLGAQMASGESAVDPVLIHCTQHHTPPLSPSRLHINHRSPNARTDAEPRTRGVERQTRPDDTLCRIPYRSCPMRITTSRRSRRRTESTKHYPMCTVANAHTALLQLHVAPARRLRASATAPGRAGCRCPRPLLPRSIVAGRHTPGSSLD